MFWMSVAAVVIILITTAALGGGLGGIIYRRLSTNLSSDSPQMTGASSTATSSTATSSTSTSSTATSSTAISSLDQHTVPVTYLVSTVAATYQHPIYTTTSNSVLVTFTTDAVYSYVTYIPSASSGPRADGTA
jgi:hypothetical protein